MAFKMKGFPMHAGTSVPMKQITKGMIEEKNKVEIAYNNKLAEEGFSTDTNLEGASEELLALKKKFDELREPFIKENMEKLKQKQVEGKGLFKMKGWSPFNKEPKKRQGDVYVGDKKFSDKPMFKDHKPSTHLMAYGEADGKFVAFPTLYQTDKGVWYQPDDPFEEAKKKKEIYLRHKEELNLSVH